MAPTYFYTITTELPISSLGLNVRQTELTLFSQESADANQDLTCITGVTALVETLICGITGAATARNGFLNNLITETLNFNIIKTCHLEGSELLPVK